MAVDTTARNIAVTALKNGGGGGGGTTSHPALSGRSNADQHPISAITGLEDKLNNSVELSGAQSISDIKTFLNLPESTQTPTNPNQFITNKFFEDNRGVIPNENINWYFDGTNGDDANDGMSQAKAFKTIAGGLLKIRQYKILNDTVLWFNTGEYNESLELTSDLCKLNVRVRPYEEILDNNSVWIKEVTVRAGVHATIASIASAGFGANGTGAYIVFQNARSKGCTTTAIAITYGAKCRLEYNFVVSENTTCAAFMSLTRKSEFEQYNRAIILEDNITFSNSFLIMSEDSIARFSGTGTIAIDGTFIGKKFALNTGCTLYTATQTANAYFPGTIDGTIVYPATETSLSSQTIASYDNAGVIKPSSTDFIIGENGVLNFNASGMPIGDIATALAYILDKEGDL